MGFLSKWTGKTPNSTEQEKAKGKSDKKAKKTRRHGKKKDITLIERMQLEESVAAASLEVVQEVANLGDSAVREVEEGLLIVAITNEALQEANVDPQGEEFGSFAQALHSETIESIALADDLSVGVVGLIPSRESLLALEEFQFVEDLAFRWALVPFDLGDEDRLTILDTTVYLEGLLQLQNQPNVTLRVMNGEVVESEADEQEEVIDQEETLEEPFPDETDELSFPEDDVPLEENEWSGMDEDNVDEESMIEEPSDTFDDPIFEEEEIETEDVPSWNDESYTTEETPNWEGHELYEDSLEEPEMDLDMTEDTIEEPTAEASKEAVHRVVSHGFTNTELNLHIDMTKFDDYFDSVSIAQFNTDRTDNSELQHVLTKLREDANVELARFHQDNVQALRNKFTTSMRDIHNKLIESLDHKDVHTTYGRRFEEIEATFEEQMGDVDRAVAGQIDRIKQTYQESREEYAEQARQEALAVYDNRHRDERNQKMNQVKDQVEADLKTHRDTELGELYQDRRHVAQRLFDKAMTALLQQLQEEYQTISQKELQMYDAFRKNMDVYLRKHFTDDVLRSKAEAEKLKQSHEAERVRNEYEQMLLTKNRQMEQADKQARDNLHQLEATHKEQIEHVQADYERRFHREQQENQNLRELLQDANASNSKIGEQKEKEVQHRMNMYKDALEAKETELSYANERANAAQKPMKFLIGAVAAVMLAVGIMAGFLFGANTIPLAPAANEAPEETQVSYQEAGPTGSHVITSPSTQA